MTDIKNFKNNIPEATAGEIAEVISDYYGKAIIKNVASEMTNPIFLWGSAGVGKSAIVRQIAQKINKITSKKVYVHDIRLTLYSVIDLRGVPVADKERKNTVWLKPKVFEMDESCEAVNILFLDELSAAPESLQAAAYQICYDRCIGEHKLPDNCLVMCAGNRVTDMSIAYAPSKALCNRVSHITVIPGFDSWRAWAVQNGINLYVKGFLTFDNSRLYAEPGTDSYAYPTPRSWEMVSNMLNLTGGTPETCRLMISATVGADIAGEFAAWYKMNRDIPSADNILKGTESRIPPLSDTVYAVISALIARITTIGADISADYLENACAYANKLPPDFAMLFYNDLREIKSIKPKLLACTNLTEWINRGIE